jgi:hypothetical protein
MGRSSSRMSIACISEISSDITSRESSTVTGLLETLPGLLEVVEVFLA